MSTVYKYYTNIFVFISNSFQFIKIFTIELFSKYSELTNININLWTFQCRAWKNEIKTAPFQRLYDYLLQITKKTSTRHWCLRRMCDPHDVDYRLPLFEESGRDGVRSEECGVRPLLVAIYPYNFSQLRKKENTATHSLYRAEGLLLSFVVNCYFG